MALDDIIRKIKSDAEAKKDEILKNANWKKESILSEWKDKAKDYEDTLVSKAKTDGENLKRGIIIDAKLKVKNAILAKKRELISKATLEAKKDIISSESYTAFIEKLLKEAVETGSEILIIAKGETRLDDKWLQKVNTNNKWNLKFSDEKGNFIGGFILQNGNIFVNATLDTLIEEKREIVEYKLAEIMFS